MGSGLDVEAPPTPRTGGRIVVATSAESDGFLPTINRWSPPTFLVARTIYDPLATIDETGEARPYLAESITSNATFTQWTIKLRPGVTFHNGEPLTASALQEHFDAARASVVVGGALTSFDGFTIPDPLTFVIDLDTPWAHLPVLLAGQVGFLPAPSMYGPNNENAPTNPVGTGPFEFTSWSQGHHLIVDRNERYWRTDADGRQLPYLDQIEFQPQPDSEVAAAQLRSGGVDVVQTETYRQVSDFRDLARDDPNGRLRALLDDSQGAESGIVLNAESGPFADRRLRLAAAYAIDRKALVDQMFNGFYEVADGPYSSESKWGTARSYPGYLPQRARQLVDEWKAAKKGRKAPVVRLTEIGGGDQVAIARQIVKWWTDAGFEVQLSNEVERIATVVLVTGQSDATTMRFWDRADPDGLFAYFIGDNVAPRGSISLNFARYRSTTVDRAIEAARASTDEGLRREQYQRVWDDFAENVPIIFLFHTRWAFGHQAKVHGLGELQLPDGSRAEPVTWGNLYFTGVWVE